jgi:hypothetical protein
MATLPLESDHPVRYTFTGFFVAFFALTDIIILAEFARKVAVGDKDGA